MSWMNGFVLASTKASHWSTTSLITFPTIIKDNFGELSDTKVGHLCFLCVLPPTPSAKSKADGLDRMSTKRQRQEYNCESPKWTENACEFDFRSQIYTRCDVMLDLFWPSGCFCCFAPTRLFPHGSVKLLLGVFEWLARSASDIYDITWLELFIYLVEKKIRRAKSTNQSEECIGLCQICIIQSEKRISSLVKVSLRNHLTANPLHIKRFPNSQFLCVGNCC